MIGNISGILVAYKGGLDNKGAVIIHEIIYVGEAEELSTIYESEDFNKKRRLVSAKDRLFFSYAEMKEGRAEATQLLKKALSCEGSLNNVKLACKGACALFPNYLLYKK